MWLWKLDSPQIVVRKLETQKSQCFIISLKAEEKKWKEKLSDLCPSSSHSGRKCLTLFVGESALWGASLVVWTVKNLLAMQEIQVWFLGWEYPLEKKFLGPVSLLGYSPWGHKESARSEWLTLSLSSALLLSWGLQLIRWGPLTSGRAICFT